MRSSIQGCPGHYDARLIVHTVKRGADVMVFENVPAQVCDVCSDILLTPDTIRHIEATIQDHGRPLRHAPVYAYA